MSEVAPLPLRHRGIVEGFYGPPYSDADRRFWVERLARLGMNRYVVAPKDAAWHREGWRDPLPAAEREAFGALVALGQERGVEVGFALAPGLSIAYSDAAEVRTLCARFRELAALGARFFSLALDDVPSELVHGSDQQAFSSLAEAHANVAHAVAEALPEDATLWLVPTDYAGTRPSAYLEELGTSLALEIEVAWTGPTVLARSIGAEDARARAATLRRPLLLWDNVPVNDGPMRRALHLGPYLGRDPGLAESCSGVLLNPMAAARASAVTVATAAAWMLAPAAYQPEEAWRAALAAVGAGAPEAFATFAAAHRFSPMEPEARDRELEDAWARFQDGGRPGEIEALLAERRGVAAALEQLDDRDLLAEIEPWRQGHHEETRRMQAALVALAAVDAAPDALSAAQAFMVFQGSLTLHPEAATVSYGPRRAFHPQLASLLQDEATFVGEVLFRRRSLVDEIVEAVEASLLPRLSA